MARRNIPVDDRDDIFMTCVRRLLENADSVRDPEACLPQMVANASIDYMRSSARREKTNYGCYDTPEALTGGVISTRENTEALETPVDVWDRVDSDMNASIIVSLLPGDVDRIFNRNPLIHRSTTLRWANRVQGQTAAHHGEVL